MYLYPRIRLYFGVALLALAAFAIRIYRLDTVPLRGDEAYSVMHWTAPPFTERWERLIREEPAPVGAFTMYWVWKGLAGESEFAMRYLSLLGNVVGLAVIIALAKRLFNFFDGQPYKQSGVAPTLDWYPAFLAGVLWVVHPYLVWHSQDARVYGVLSALTPLAFYTLVRGIDSLPRFYPSSHANQRFAPLSLPKGGHDTTLLEKPGETNGFVEARRGKKTPLHLLQRGFRGEAGPAWRLYILVQTAAIYLYYLEPFWLAAQGLFVLLVVRRWDVFKQAFRAWMIVGVLSIPVMAQLYHLMFVSGYQGNAVSADFSAFFSEFVPTLLFGDNLWHPVVGALVAAGLFAGLGWVWWRRSRRVAGLVFLWIFVPNILLYGVSFYSDFFRPRYVTTVIPALILAAVMIGVYASLIRLHPPSLSPKTGEGEENRSQRVFMSPLHLLERGFRGEVRTKNRDLAIARQYHNAAPLRRSIVHILFWGYMLVSLVEIYDYFVNDPPKAADWRGLSAYLQARTTPNDAIISGAADPALEYYYRGPGTIQFVPKAEPDPADYLPGVLRDYRAVFVLAGERTAAVGQYLQAHAQPIPGETYPGVIQYRSWAADPAEIDNPLDVPFGEVAKLRGYTLLDDTTLILYWEAVGQTENEHSILVHLESAPDAPPAMVLDHAIAGAVISTRTWTPGTLYRDPVALPPDLLPGDYWLRVGIYESSTQISVAVTESSETRYPLDQIRIR